MTHKQRCIQHCKDYLDRFDCSHYYNSSDFEHIYRKFNGAQGNAFSIGLDAADYILQTAKFQYHDAGNEN